MSAGKRLSCGVLAFAIVMFGATLTRADPPPISVYAADPAFVDLAISPSGQHVALIANINGGRRLLIVDAQQKPLLSADIGKLHVQGIAWAGEDRLVLIYTSVAELGLGFNVQRAALRGAFVYAVDGNQAPWEVFSKGGNFNGGIRNYYGFVQRDGKVYGYFSGGTLARDPGGAVFQTDRPELFEVDLTDRTTRKVAAKPDGVVFRGWMMAPGGGIAATLDRNVSTGEWRLSNGDGKQIAAGRNKLAALALEALGPNADTVIVGETNEDGRRELIEVPLAGGIARRYPTAGIVEQIIVDTGHRLLGYTEDNDARTMHFVSAHNQAVGRALIKAFPGEQVQWVGASDDVNRVIVRTDGPRDTGTWWLVDMRTGNAEDLGTAYAVPAAAIAPTSLFEYKASDGLQLDGALTLPPGAGKMLPVVILSGMADRNTARFTAWSQMLASRGYAVFQPNPRGTAGKGDDFHAAGYGQQGRSIQTDISDGLAALAVAGIVDPRRACIMGMRDGGYAALAGVTLQRGLYRCAISIAANGDLERAYQRLDHATGGSRADLTRMQKLMGDPHDFAKISPAAHAADADAPILLMHAKNDPNVDYEQSITMQRALQRAGKPVELITLPNGDGLLEDAAARQLAMEATLRFIERYNPGGAASR